MLTNSYKFELPSHHKSIIKVIGVGGGGSNAVNHMFKQGIKDVEFVVCNTDAQALNSSPVPTKLQIGLTLTDGLGAGANPERGRNAALESKEEIREFMSNNTRMVFITAGMGGGTGTGAAPVIAKIAKELDILTVGIVTAPFAFEGKKKRQQADIGINDLRANCDTMLVIENDKLRMIYGNLSIREAFAQADNVLSTAAKSIAEIITVTSDVNVDFEDVKTVMKDSGAAVMGSAVTRGENRARRAAEEALSSPLLNNTNILGAKKILLSIAYGNEGELTMDELTEITDFIEEKAGDSGEVIFGQGVDTTLGDQVRVTVIATGFFDATQMVQPTTAVEFETEDVKKVFDLESQKTIRAQAESDKLQYDFEFNRNNNEQPKNNLIEQKDLNLDKSNTVKAQFENIDLKLPSAPNHGYEYASHQKPAEEIDFFEQKRKYLLEQAKERIKRLGGMSPSQNMNPDEFKEKLEVPAFQRKKVNLKEIPHSSEKDISRYNLSEDNEIIGNNKFLHDNVD